MLILNNHKEKEKIINIGIIILNKEKYKIIKSASNKSTRNYNNKYTSALIQDLIIRGYHKYGENCCINYK